ncbi:conserved exported hypothetical protein [Nitrospira lenta]|uniref:Uncharacterized protein n=1 Tax=Nitrospira lenta TaxID=1436998 RepID=A0A330KZZ5_9BACT|nr:conserved exported hypothetical protein [Nitrospira lenta]
MRRLWLRGCTNRWRTLLVTLSSAGCCLLVVGLWLLPAHGKDLMPQKEQETTEVGSTSSPSFDDQKAGTPQSLFTWIKMARGYEVEWDTFGRKGWYTQDPRLKPVDPASVFTPDAAVVYIVFESAPLEDPTQFSAQWFLEGDDGALPSKPFGQDVLELPGYERYGFLELKRPGERWPVGAYVVKLYIAPHGQQSFHAVNQVGTLRFTITDKELPPSPPVR